MSKEILPKDQIARPFLRWVGGKTWLLKHLPIVLNGHTFNNFHEPFLGGGAFFFLFNSNERKAFLSDLNKDLIETYLCVKRDIEGVIKELKRHRNTENYYYSIRKKYFESPTKRAAQFIYLNQTSFNGIYRVNLKGKYNVPFGYRNKNFLEPNNLRLVNKRLNNSHIFADDFEAIKSNIKKNDLVFLDPPYTVSHNNNSFIKYNQKLFSLEDQYRLSVLIDFIKSKGAFYILSNAAHIKVAKIFEKGDTKIVLERASVVGGREAQRDIIKEYLFTNLKSR